MSTHSDLSQMIDGLEPLVLRLARGRPSNLSDLLVVLKERLTRHETVTLREWANYYLFRCHIALFGPPISVRVALREARVATIGQFFPGLGPPLPARRPVPMSRLLQ